MVSNATLNRINIIHKPRIAQEKRNSQPKRAAKGKAAAKAKAKNAVAEMSGDQGA